jgi:SHS2 domain-containing protein
VLSAHYDYFDHEADIGIIGSGPTLEAAFVQAARAVFACMVNLDEVQPLQSRTIEFIEEDNELALVEWLNALLGEARQSNLVFSSFTLRREQNRWSGQAYGEPWRDSLERGTEVKGATLTMLSVKSDGAEWEARCVIDV